MASTGDSIAIDGNTLVQEDFSYGGNELQTLTVYHPMEKKAHNADGLWIVYIHGGAWRDPLVTDKAILPTIQHLLSHSKQSELLHQHVAAFASVSYRLSPHPSFPQDDSTPANQLRNATHPDHLKDILASITFLQSKYGFGSNYVLIGHSCGATLAMQTVLRGKILPNSTSEFKGPKILVGIAGIYNMRLLVDTHESVSVYRTFTVSAFGESETVWDALSPAKIEGLDELWPEGKKLYLFHSTNDELIDVGQIDEMAQHVKDTKIKVEVSKDLLRDAHDDIWAKAVGMASVIAIVLKSLGDRGV